jgi:NitT/TauT family transport system substrate-binding protein
MTKNELRIGHLSTAYHTNFILMEDSNFRKSMKSKIEWILFGTGPEMVNSFRDGNLEIGYMGIPPAIVGIDKGAPIKCVAGGHIEGTVMISNNQYKSIEKLENDQNAVLTQFVGENVGVTSKGSIHEVILSQYLKQYKLEDDVNVYHYSQAEFIALDMKNGKLVAGVGTPALAVFTSMLTDSHIIIPPSKFYPYNPSYGIFFREDIIEDFPEKVKIFLKFHKKASNLLRENPKEAAKIICKHLAFVDDTYVKNVLEISPKYCIALSDNFINTSIEFTQKLYELGYISEKKNVDDIFVAEFIQEVHPEPDHYRI